MPVPIYCRNCGTGEYLWPVDINDPDLHQEFTHRFHERYKCDRCGGSGRYIIDPRSDDEHATGDLAVI